jgi:hypothetical protein
MDVPNAIRSGIFLVPGLLLILFPKKVCRFPMYFFDRFHIKYNIERDLKHCPYIGIVFIIISIILLVFSITH